MIGFAVIVGWFTLMLVLIPLAAILTKRRRHKQGRREHRFRGTGWGWRK